jgi:hypothetical protein
MFPGSGIVPPYHRDPASGRPVDICWYAPFDNACEIEIARHLRRRDDRFTYQSLSHRFGNPSPGNEMRFYLQRDEKMVFSRMRCVALQGAS